mgnify:CR=1 FL=1
MVADSFTAIESNVRYVDGSAELDDCPLGDMSELASTAAVLVDLPNGVVDGELTVDAYGAEPDYPALIQCFTALPADDSLTIDDPQSFGVSVSGLPSGSYRQFLLDAAFGDGTTVVVERSRQRHDGDVFGYLYSGEVVGCGADWVDREHEIAISVYLDGAERTSDECIKVLDATLERLMSGLIDYSKTTPWANGKSLE